MSPRPNTVVDIIDMQAASLPDAPAFTFLTDGDGAAEVMSFAALHRETRCIAAALAIAAVALAWPLLIEYLETGLVPRFPTAILSTGLVILAFMSVVVGLVLDTVTLGRRELKRLHYLGLRGPTLVERRRSHDDA